MRPIVVVLLVLLVLLLALPIGMASMDPCPACAVGGPGAWGLCLAILGLLALAVPTMNGTLRTTAPHLRPLLLVSLAEKPPRSS